jgi:hypothetical protein
VIAARLRLSLLLVACLALSVTPPLHGQAPAPTAAGPAAAEPGSELRVYVMTMGPGTLVWERFGHNAVWVHDPERGTDKAYNYGLFDFAQENFLLRFIQGRMWYWMEGFDAYLTADHYAQDDRTVWVQELNLTPAERLAVRDFLEWNERPENRFYRYDYYRDNCSTRVRDVVDLALGGLLRERTQDVPSGTTFRSHTRRLTTSDVPIYTGLMMGLGSPVDREISRWEEMFLPLSLREQLSTMTRLDATGREVPLVLAEHVLYESTRAPVREVPPTWWPWYLLVGVVIGVTIAALAAPSARGRRPARYGFALLTGLWSLLAGVGGVVLAGLWAFTDHEAAYANENLFQLNPLSVLVLLTVPALAYGVRRWERLALLSAFGVVALSLLGLLLKPLPWLTQVNLEVVALALPIHLGVAFGAWWLANRAPTRPSAGPAPSSSKGAARGRRRARS